VADRLPVALDGEGPAGRRREGGLLPPVELEERKRTRVARRITLKEWRETGEILEGDAACDRQGGCRLSQVSGIARVPQFSFLSRSISSRSWAARS
jgi:hypothetical protein